MSLQTTRDRLINRQEEKQDYNSKQRQVTATPSPIKKSTEQIYKTCIRGSLGFRFDSIYYTAHKNEGG